MNFLNIKNVHDNIKSQLKVGLEKATSFLIKNDGSAISLADDANTVTKLVVGGSSGFTIRLSGNYIVFSSNSGSSPLAIKEPGRGGIPGCSFYYCHVDKYSGGAAMSMTDGPAVASLSLDAEDPVETTECPYANVTTLPNASDLPDNTIMMVKNGEWVSIDYDCLLAQLKDDLNA